MGDVANGPLAIVSPNSTTNYTVNAYNNITNCSNSKTITVNVIPQPTVIINGPSQICSGTTVTLTSSGAQSYLWSTGATSSNLFLNAGQSTFVSVIGTSNTGNCKDSASHYLSVLPNPTLNVIYNYTICEGETVSLSASGANTYSWSNGSNGSFISVSPLLTTNYTVTGLDSSGICSDSKSLKVIVLECLGVNNSNSFSNHVKLFPNPAQNNLIIETEFLITYKIADALGKIILLETIRPGIHYIDLSKFSSGVYLVTLSDQSHSKTIKLIKSE